MLKLIRDWLEKFSVGSILVAVYQSTTGERGLLAFSLGSPPSPWLFTSQKGV
jgi:hypothetical protein